MQLKSKKMSPAAKAYIEFVKLHKENITHKNFEWTKNN